MVKAKKLNKNGQINQEGEIHNFRFLAAHQNIKKHETE